MEIQNTRTKYVYIEQLRVAATLAVILLHCYAPVFTNSGIFGTKTWWGVNILNAFSRWGVPVFIMISGILLLDSSKQESIKDFITKRSTRVLVPFVFWSAVYYVATAILTKGPVSVIGFVGKFLANDISYHFWFVYTLFGIYLLVPVLRKLIGAISNRELWYLFGLIFFTSTMRPVIDKLFGISMPPIVPIYEGYLAWFLYGYLINRVNFKHAHRITVYGLGVAGGLASIAGTYLLSDTQKIDAFFNGGYQLNSYMVATAVFVFFKYELSGRLKRLDNVSVEMGKLSYGVYLIHVLVLIGLQRLMRFNEPYKEILVSAILAFLISYAIMYALSKIPKVGRIMSGTR